MTYYKVLDVDGFGPYSGKPWPLPTGDTPGEWMRVKGTLKACHHGLHLCRPEHLVAWLGPTVYEAEVDPQFKVVDAGNKVVVRRARLVRRLSWSPRMAAAFAADCVARVDHLRYVVTSSPFAESAARSASIADRAARNAARDPRVAFADAATAAYAAAIAVRYAANYDDAAYDAERAWQTARLVDYLEGRAT